MIDGEQRGPFPLDQLAAEGVRPSTYVWTDGMDDWEKAEDVADICRLFRNRLHDLMHPGSVQAELRQEATPYRLKDIPDASPTRYDRHLKEGESFPSLEEIDAREDHSLQPPSLILPAVLVAILFCPLVGLIAVVYAVKTRNAWKQGEKDKAYDYHRSAKMWIGITFFLGLILAAFVMRRSL